MSGVFLGVLASASQQYLSVGEATTKTEVPPRGLTSGLEGLLADSVPDS